MSATIIAVANQKGGTGKTTTCENLGIGLANKGKHVLLVDTDPQASLTIVLGHPRPDDLPVTLTDLITNVMQERPVNPEETILSHTEGVDLIPASIMLVGLEVSLVNAMSRETVLKQVLESVRSQYITSYSTACPLSACLSSMRSPLLIRCLFRFRRTICLQKVLSSCCRSL